MKDQPQHTPHTETTPPYRLTKAELRCVANNADKILTNGTSDTDRMIAKLRAMAVLNHAGVPETDQPQAAVEASYRNAFGQQSEKEVASSMGNSTILRVVPGERLNRPPFPDRFLKV